MAVCIPGHGTFWLGQGHRATKERNNLLFVLQRRKRTWVARLAGNEQLEMGTRLLSRLWASQRLLQSWSLCVGKAVEVKCCSHIDRTNTCGWWCSLLSGENGDSLTWGSSFFVKVRLVIFRLVLQPKRRNGFFYLALCGFLPRKERKNKLRPPRTFKTSCH